MVGTHTLAELWMSASILGESTESDGFAGPIFPSQISSKKMADTRYCGPPSY